MVINPPSLALATVSRTQYAEKAQPVLRILEYSEEADCAKNLGEGLIKRD
jgi:hypothetical protein